MLDKVMLRFSPTANPKMTRTKKKKKKKKKLKSAVTSLKQYSSIV